MVRGGGGLPETAYEHGGPGACDLEVHGLYSSGTRWVTAHPDSCLSCCCRLRTSGGGAASSAGCTGGGGRAFDPMPRPAPAGPGMREAPALGFARRPATGAAALAGAQPLLAGRAKVRPLPADPVLPAAPTPAPLGRCLSTRLTLGALVPTAAAGGPGCLAEAGRPLLLPRSADGCPTPADDDAVGGTAEACLAPPATALTSLAPATGAAEPAAAGRVTILPVGTADAGRGMREPRLTGGAAAPVRHGTSWV